MAYISQRRLYEHSASSIVEFLYCEKSFWLLRHDISMSTKHINMKVGREEHKARQAESTNPWLKYDKKEDGKIIEYVKRNKRMDGKKNQLLIYLLRDKSSAGEVRETNTDKLLLEVEVTDENILELNRYLKRMTEVMNMSCPPEVSLENKCYQCNFLEYCWG